MIDGLRNHGALLYSFHYPRHLVSNRTSQYHVDLNSSPAAARSDIAGLISVKSKLTSAILVFALLSMTGATARISKYEPGGWCCLCMCHAVDEKKCASVCVKMQHGRKIIEEPEMKSCTKSCLRYGVKQIFPEEFVDVDVPKSSPAPLIPVRLPAD